MNRDSHEARRIGTELSLLEATLRRVAGDNAYEAFRDLCVFHKDVLPGLEVPVIQILEAAAKELGFIESDNKPHKKPTRIRKWRAPIDATRGHLIAMLGEVMIALTAIWLVMKIVELVSQDEP